MTAAEEARHAAGWCCARAGQNVMASMSDWRWWDGWDRWVRWASA